MEHGMRHVNKRGLDLIRDPLLNKGAAFTSAERRAFGLDGLLPPATVGIDIQAQRILANVDRLPQPLQKYVSLAALHDRNEHLFFAVLIQRLEQLLPIVYTPTVGIATQNFSNIFQRGRGVWLTPALKNRMPQVLRNAAEGRDIRLIVVTDNESILGIGDQGAGGMAISIGKLAIYTAAAGIDPAGVLPVSLDVGTENETLLNDPLYLGVRERRMRGEPYLAFVDEFVAAVKAVFPQCLVQWEDFRKDNALRVLDRYRDRIPSFNDDIQGTGAVTLAGLLCAARVTSRPLADERIVICGGGAAGLGIARQIRAALAAAGIGGERLRHAIAVLDSRGLIVDDGTAKDAYKQELSWANTEALRLGLTPAARGLAEVVAAFRPTTLIGTSGQPGAFTEAIVRRMAAQVDRPLILPLSNPTALCEATPADLYAWTDARALVASGSPFADVSLGGRTYRIGQGNNAFIFPGVGLAALVARLPQIGNDVFLDAARALAATVTAEELRSGLIYPPIARLREVSFVIARDVLRGLVERGSIKAPAAGIDETLRNFAWEPVYRPYQAV
jgi:malic enzyme